MYVQNKCGVYTLYTVQCTVYNVHFAANTLHICVISLLFTF